MAYRDLRPTGAADGKTVLLLHGKNFSGFYWEPTIEFLAQQGYRVIAPDQLGFGASSRPDIHYSFHQMAQNTKALLDHLGIPQVDVIAHSMGGMLGVRFTLLFPETVEKLVLENPIGFEDYRKLVPYIALQQQYAAELSQTYENMRDYQKSYYPGAWKPEYEVYVQDQASVLGTGEYPRDAWSSALTYEMIYEQPIVYEVGEISRPTLLIIGQADRTVSVRIACRPHCNPSRDSTPSWAANACRHQGLNLGRGSGLRPHTAHPEAGGISQRGGDVPRRRAFIR